jgi:hypothetical protein
MFSEGKPVGWREGGVNLEVIMRNFVVLYFSGDCRDAG